MMRRKLLVILGLVSVLVIVSVSAVLAQEDEPVHPVLWMISTVFDVEYDDVLALSESGAGAGEIGRAFLTAYASEGELTTQEVLDMHVAGVGWGEIMHEFNIHPGNNGLGSLMRQAFDEPLSTPEPGPEGSCAEGEDPADCEPTDGEDPTVDEALHPVAQQIAEAFDVSYEDIIALHESGVGFGVIGRAFMTAEASDGELTFEDVLALHQSGMGWGRINQEYGVHPGGNGLGAIMHSDSDEGTSAGDAPGHNRGNNRSGGGNGNGNSNPGGNGPKDK